MDKVDKNFLIVQSNALIEKKRFLSLDEQKIVLIFASLINQDDEELKIYEIEVNKIMNILEVKNKGKYAALKETVYSLASKPIKFEKENKKGFTIIQWFSYADYDNGVLKVKFVEELKPYLLQLKELFTKYKLENILHMKSKYSIQLYELLKSHEYKKEICIDIEDLKNIFGLGDKYKRYNDFKKRTILKASEDINGKTDINFDFKEIKDGKFVKKIKFIINPTLCDSVKETNKFKEIDTEMIIKLNLLKSVIHIELQEKDYISILDAANEDLAKVISKYYLIKDTKNIKNFTGLLIKAIKEDYDEIVTTKEESKKIVKTKFHNFEERFEKYTPEELEKIILEKQKRKFK